MNFKVKKRFFYFKINIYFLIEKNIYFLIDSENSILSQIYLNADGKYLTNQKKWFFNEYSKLIDTFKISLIECEQKILENDELQKKTNLSLLYFR